MSVHNVDRILEEFLILTSKASVRGLVSQNEFLIFSIFNETYM